MQLILPTYITDTSQGEKAYKAFLQWMQKESHYCATYDVLLQALCKTKEVDEDTRSITNTWWYAHQYLNSLTEQPVNL